MIRVLWHSNAPWVGTGYGTQTALFAPRLSELGYETAVSAFFGLHGVRRDWSDAAGRTIRIYPGGLDGHGNDVLGRHAQDWFSGGGGLVITLTDVWVLASEMISALPCAAWAPVDHVPAPEKVVGWFRRSGAVPIAMSRFGERQLTDAGLEPLYVPHGVDPDVFHPGDRTEARAAIQVPNDLFLVGMVAANVGVPSRKGFSQALVAYAAFAKDKPDVGIYLHTRLFSPVGESIVSMCRSLDVRPYVVDQYLYQTGLDAGHVVQTMRALDVLLNPSHGEGFGLPTLEAQSCGTPVIATDFSAMSEVVSREGGWLVDGQYEWNHRFEAWQVCPNVAEVLRALEEAYEEWRGSSKLEKRRDLAVSHAARYDVQHVLNEYWAPVLQESTLRTKWSQQQPLFQGR